MADRGFTISESVPLRHPKLVQGEMKVKKTACPMGDLLLKLTSLEL